MKKLLFIVIFFGIVLKLFFFCKNNDEKAMILRGIDFKTGVVDFKSSYIGTCFDKTEQKDIIYFVDKKSCIKRYYLTGEKKDSVPLNETIDFLKNCNDVIRIVTTYSSDTILILSKYKNYILSVNGKGEIYRVISRDSILPDSVRGLLGIDNVWSTGSNSDYNNLIYTLYPKQEYYMKYYSGIDTLGLYEQMLLMNKFDFELPYFINIKGLYTDSLKFNFVIEDYAYRHYEQGEFIFRFNDFKVIKDKLFVLPFELDKISVYSINGFEHLEDVKITSKYTEIGQNPLTIKEYLNESDFYQTIGRVQNIFYNEEQEQFYVVVSHAFKNETELKAMENGKFRAFSIIVYEKNFDNSREFVFEANTYAGSRSYMTSEGLLIERKPKELTINNYGIQTFDLFNFN